MPKYTFMCPNCGHSFQQQVHRTIKKMACPKCPLADMERLLPSLNGSPTVSEIIDKVTGKAHKQDQSTMVRERKSKYFWSVEVPRMVNSGVYGVDTMLQQGWIWFNDKKQMQIYTIPPHKR